MRDVYSYRFELLEPVWYTGKILRGRGYGSLFQECPLFKMVRFGSKLAIRGDHLEVAYLVDWINNLRHSLE